MSARHKFLLTHYHAPHPVPVTPSQGTRSLVISHHALTFATQVVCSVPSALAVSLLSSLLTLPVLEAGAPYTKMHEPTPYMDLKCFFSGSLISSMYIPSPILIEFLSHLFLVAINPVSACFCPFLSFHVDISALTFKSAWMAPYLLNSQLTATAHIAMPILLQTRCVRN